MGKHRQIFSPISTVRNLRLSLGQFVLRGHLQHRILVCLTFILNVVAISLPLPVAGAPSSPGRIFLTFDDGPIDATMDILDVLKAENIRATFFINAIHLDGKGGEHENDAPVALRRIIAENHVLGNHSYDHMGHNRPMGSYSIAASQAYRNVETDLAYFIPANITPVNISLGTLSRRPNNQISKLARLPFSNVWMVPRLNVLCSWCQTGSGVWWHASARAKAEHEVSDAGGQVAVALFQRYEVITYGWDIQWRPPDWTLPAVSEAMPGAEIIEQTILELLDDNHARTQRITRASRMRPVRKGNVIVLTHDFLFENGKRGRGRDVNMPQLISLIKSLKAKGYSFDTLDHYLE
jgi:chitin disaccharide deacetylase